MYLSISIFMQLIFISIIDDAVAMNHGKSIKEGEFKFMAYIESLIDGQNYLCGGAVINEFHVITAAHCVVCSELSKITIFVGSISIPPPATYFRQPVRVHVPPNFPSTHHKSIKNFCQDYLASCASSKTSKYPIILANDIAIMKVNRRISFGINFMNVNLPVSTLLPYCDLLHVAGWYTPKTSSWSATLQSTEVELIRTNDCCVLHSSEHFCAYTMDRVGRFGPGDSGTPLVHHNILYGIITGGSCNASNPFILTKIFHHIDFITEALEKGKEPEVGKKRKIWIDSKENQDNMPSGKKTKL